MEICRQLLPCNYPNGFVVRVAHGQVAEPMPPEELKALRSRADLADGEGARIHVRAQVEYRAWRDRLCSFV